MAKRSEAEIFRDAVIFWPASTESGTITGTCFDCHMRLCDCCGDVVKDPKENLCPGCRKFANERLTNP